MDILPIELEELIIENIFPISYNERQYLSLIIISHLFHNYLLLKVKRCLQKASVESRSNSEMIYYYKCILHPVMYKKINPIWNIRNPYIYTALDIFLKSDKESSIIISQSYLELYILQSIISNFYPKYKIIDNIDQNSQKNTIMLIHLDILNTHIHTYAGKFDIVIPIFDWYNKNLMILLNIRNPSAQIILINDMIHNIEI